MIFTSKATVTTTKREPSIHSFVAPLLLQKPGEFNFGRGFGRLSGGGRKCKKSLADRLACLLWAALVVLYCVAILTNCKRENKMSRKELSPFNTRFLRTFEYFLNSLRFAPLCRLHAIKRLRMFCVHDLVELDPFYTHHA